MHKMGVGEAEGMGEVKARASLLKPEPLPSLASYLLAQARLGSVHFYRN